MIYGKQDQTWVDRTAKLPGVKVVGDGAGRAVGSCYLNITVEAARRHPRAPGDRACDRPQGDRRSSRARARRARRCRSCRPAISAPTRRRRCYPYDLAKAKALLAEAGYPNGITIKTIHTTLTGMQTLIEAVQAQLKKAGIKLDIELVEHATFHAQIRKDLSPIVHYQAARFPVADVYLTQFFDSRSIVGTPTAVTNFATATSPTRRSTPRASRPIRRSRRRCGRPRRRRSSRRSAACRSTSSCRSGRGRIRSISATSCRARSTCRRRSPRRRASRSDERRDRDRRASPARALRVPLRG